MRVTEIISEEIMYANVDWQRWKAFMAASAIERNVPKGIDAIVYLGIIGDPSKTELGIKFKRPAQIGLDVSKKGQGHMVSPYAIAQYNPNEWHDGKDFDILFNFQGEPLERRNWGQFQDALSNTLAHELMHRGLEIIAHIPAIVNQIPEPTRSYFANRKSSKIAGLINDEDPNQIKLAPSGHEYFEHMIIYAMFVTTQNMNYYKEKNYTEWVQKFKRLYMDIEKAANQYVLSYPIPPGSLAALRDEIDGKTPSNIDVKVGMGPNNVPTVTLSTVNKILDLMKPQEPPAVDPVKKIQGLMKK
jgi:hypothetical protein